MLLLRLYARRNNRSILVLPSAPPPTPAAPALGLLRGDARNDAARDRRLSATPSASRRLRAQRAPARSRGSRPPEADGRRRRRRWCMAVEVLRDSPMPVTSALALSLTTKWSIRNIRADNRAAAAKARTILRPTEVAGRLKMSDGVRLRARVPARHRAAQGARPHRSVDSVRVAVTCADWFRARLVRCRLRPSSRGALHLAPGDCVGALHPPRPAAQRRPGPPPRRRGRRPDARV